jgi:hypothetical protein
LNDYLDNQAVSSSSGKEDIHVRSTCKVLTVTNPVIRSNNSIGVRSRLTLREMFGYIDNDFLGRFLLVNQNKMDTDWVTGNQNLEKGNINTNITKDKFLACYDFMNDLRIIDLIDEDRFSKVLAKIKVPIDCNDVYRKMSSNMAYLLFDGYVKWKMFCNRSDVNIIDDHYKGFEIIWNNIINRWFTGDSFVNFTEDEKYIIDIIKKNRSITNRHFFELCKDKGVDNTDLKSRLIEKNIVKENLEKKLEFIDGADIINIF